MWDIKLKATNDRTRQTNKQQLIDTENIMVAARGERGWEKVEEGKQGQICGDRRRFDFRWRTQCNIQIMYCRIIYFLNA